MIHWFPGGFPKITEEEIKEVQRLNENFVSIDYPEQPVDDIPKVIQTDSLQKSGPEPSFNPNLIVNCCDPNEIYQIGPNPLTNTSWVYAHSAQGVLDLYAITGVTGLNITNYTQAFRANFLHTETFQNQHITPYPDCERNTGYKCWHLAEQDPNWVVSPHGVASRIDFMPAKRYESCEDLFSKLTNGDWVSQVYYHFIQTMVPHKTYMNAIAGSVETDIFHKYPNLCTFNPNRIANCCEPNYQWQICGNMLKALTEVGRILRYTASGQPVPTTSTWYQTAPLGLSSYTQSFRANFWFKTDQDPWYINVYIPGIGYNKWPVGSACWHLTEEHNLNAPAAIKSFAWNSPGSIEVFPSCRHLNMHLYATMVSPYPYWGSLYTGNTNIPPWCAYSYIDTTGYTQGGAVIPCDPCPPPDQTSPFYTTDNFCKRECVDNQGNPLPNAPIDCGCCYPSPPYIEKTKCHCCNNQGQVVMPNNNDYTDCSTLDGTLNPSSGMYNCVPVNQQLLCKNSSTHKDKRLIKPIIPTALTKWLARSGI